MLSFEWNARKVRQNSQKHGVTFEEARTVFYDEQAIQFFDEPHSSEEDRFLMLGLSSRLRILVVAHCFRESDGKIRIISARRATPRERAHYRGTKQ